MPKYDAAGRRIYSAAQRAARRRRDERRRGGSPALRRPPRSAMEPLRLRAWLQTPVISDEFLPIDGVLYYEAMRQRYGDQCITYPGGSHADAVAGVPLPLARREEQGPLWYYAASFAQWPDAVAEGRDHWNARVDFSWIDLVDWRGRKARIDVASAEFKSYHMPVFYRHALWVDWYCVGEPRSIEGLLSQITHLGKKTSQGWGAVRRWDMGPWPEDWSVRNAAGQLMRAIPHPHGVLRGFRPSYWLPKNQAPCLLPTSIGDER